MLGRGRGVGGYIHRDQTTVPRLDWAGDSLRSGDCKALNSVEVKCSRSHEIATSFARSSVLPMIVPTDPTLAESRIQLRAARGEQVSLGAREANISRRAARPATFVKTGGLVISQSLQNFGPA